MLMAGLLVLSGGALVTSCDDSDDYDTNQFKGSVSLTAAQLQVTRGGYMTFKGNGLNKVNEVVFVGASVTDIEVVDEHTIRCLVPEAAEPGVVKLIYSGGELTTKEIAFTEPITFTELVAEELLVPGQEITVKGTYLTLIDFVQFGTDAALPQVPYTMPIKGTSRTEMKVVVPPAAVSGEFCIGYYSVEGQDTILSLIPVAKGEGSLNIAQPTNIKLDKDTYKAGEDVTISGDLLRLVSEVKFANSEALDVAAKDPTQDVKTIKVKLPATATDGAVTLVLLNGAEITLDAIKTVVPNVTFDAEKSYGVGEKIVFSGENLDLIANVTLLNGKTAELTLAEDGTMTAVVDTTAQSGEITFGLKNGTEYKIDGFKTAKPQFTFPADATPLDEITFESTLADRIVSFNFGDCVAEVTVDGKNVKFALPLDAKSGAVTCTMSNGETYDAVESFTVNAFTFCAVRAFVSEPKMLSMFEITALNLDQLTKVQLNGKDVAYVKIDERRVFIYSGDESGESTLSLFSGDKEVKYTVNVQSIGLVETPLALSGMEFPITQVTNDEGKPINLTLNYDGVSLDELEGSIIRIRYSKTSDLPKINVFAGQWGAVFNGMDDSAGMEIVKNSEYIDIPYEKLPAYALYVAAGRGEEVGWWGNDIILQGEGVIFTGISYVFDYSDAAKTIWSGEIEMGNWAGNLQMKAADMAEFTTSTVFTVELANVADGAQVSIKSMADGWPGLTSANENDEWGVSDLAGKTSFQFSLDADDLAAVKEFGMAIGGHDATIVKLTAK